MPRAALWQVCKCEEDAAREAAALEAMHRVLEFAAAGALRYASIQCLVLAVFTLHTCRGRGTPEQLAWRREQAAALGERFGGPAGSASRWAKTKWVDPRVESYDKDRWEGGWGMERLCSVEEACMWGDVPCSRASVCPSLVARPPGDRGGLQRSCLLGPPCRFPFEWEPYSSKNLKEWIEAVSGGHCMQAAPVLRIAGARDRVPLFLQTCAFVTVPPVRQTTFEQWPVTQHARRCGTTGTSSCPPLLRRTSWRRSNMQRRAVRPARVQQLQSSSSSSSLARRLGRGGTMRQSRCKKRSARRWMRG